MEDNTLESKSSTLPDGGVDVPRSDQESSHDVLQPEQELPEVVNSHRSMVVDPVSGFVEGSRGDSFIPADQKQEFLQFLRRFWPNVSKACAMSGFSYRSYKHHLDIDVKFKAACEEIKREVLDELEELGTGFASTSKGFMHWIAILRAHRPERWSNEQRVLIQHELGPEQTRLKRDNLAQVIAADAEVIQATTGKKPPTLPDMRPPAPRPEATTPPENPSEVPSNVSIEPLPTGGEAAPEAGGKPTGGEALPDSAPLPSLGDELDNFGDFCNTSSADEYDIESLARRKLPPKKPTG